MRGSASSGAPITQHTGRILTEGKCRGPGLGIAKLLYSYRGVLRRVSNILPCTRFSVLTSWLPSGQPVAWKTRLRAASQQSLWPRGCPGRARHSQPPLPGGTVGVGPPASRALGAKFQQQAASLVISTQKDETSQTDGRHAREDTCKQS